MRRYTQTAFDVSQYFNIFRAWAGLILGIRNLFTATDRAKLLDGSGGDYFAYSMAAIIALSALCIGAYKKQHNISTPLLVEKCIAAGTRTGVFCSPLILAQMNMEFSESIHSDKAKEISFIAMICLMEAFALSADLLQKLTQSDLVQAFIQSCPKTGTWMVATMGALLVQDSVFHQQKTNAEMTGLSVMMGFLLSLEFGISCASIKIVGADNAKKFLENPLPSTATARETLLWTINLPTEFGRALVTMFASLSVILNVLHSSHHFSDAENAKTMQVIVALLAVIGGVFGVNNVLATGYNLFARREVPTPMQPLAVPDSEHYGSCNRFARAA